MDGSTLTSVLPKRIEHYLSDLGVGPVRDHYAVMNLQSSDALTNTSKQHVHHDLGFLKVIVVTHSPAP